MQYWNLPSPTGPASGLAKAARAALAAAAAVIFFFHYRAVFRGWFFREDSRYFSNGFFSPYDVVSAFLTTRNAMGHYRPITKLLWGVPEWLGLGNASLYHAVLWLGLGVSGILLMRLAYLLFGDALLAILAGALWLLMPVNAKPLYWICACQDVTASLFTFAALVLRFEQWRRPDREGLCRKLCLACMLLAVSSREVGFSGTLLLFLVDWRFGKLRRSGDVALLWGLAFWFVFLLDPPFARANVHPSPLALFLPSTLVNFWHYCLAALWTLGDAFQADYPLPARALTALLLLTGLVGSRYHWSFLFASLLGLAGVVPFLLIHALSVEYSFLLGAGLALLLTGLPALLLRERRAHGPFTQGAVLAAGLAALGGYYSYLQQSRWIYEHNYTSRSLLLRNFMDELGAFSRAQPPFRLLELKSLGPYFESDARDSHHFIPPGADRLIPDRTILIAPEVLKTGEETGIRNPRTKLWTRTYSDAEASLGFRYTEKGFQLD